MLDFIYGLTVQYEKIKGIFSNELLTLVILFSMLFRKKIVNFITSMVLKSVNVQETETTKKNNESLGEDALKIESTTTKLMDKDVPAIVADLTMGGVTQYTTQAFVEVGGRIYTIATITTNAEESSKGLDMFTKAE